MVRGIDHIEIIVKDVEEFIAFFEKMGFRVLTRTAHHGASAELQLPGENQPIKLLVRRDSEQAVYEALPASSYGANVIGRDLVPFIDDGNPNRFKWPPNLGLRPTFPSGYSTLHISVLDVGAQLVGEQVSLIVKAPVTFKSTAPGYGFLWWFVLWPVYALLLLAYAAVLLWWWRPWRLVATKQTRPRTP